MSIDKIYICTITNKEPMTCAKRNVTRYLFALFVINYLFLYFPIGSHAIHTHEWSENDIITLKSLWIGSLPPVPVDPSNKYAENLDAIRLGQKIFHDNRFSGNLKISCATCHPSEDNFVDSLPQSHGMGATTRRSMPLIGVGYNTWFFWDGRADSLWAQALGPPESDNEHGITRTYFAYLIKKHYSNEYEDIFGSLAECPPDLCPPGAKPDISNAHAYKAWMSIPDHKRDEITRVYVNMGKAIAAYVRLIVPTPSRFDRYVEALIKGDKDALPGLMSSNEVAGLRLFIGKAQCINCHNGPLFTNGEFHNIDVPQPTGLPDDRGRSAAIPAVLSHEFNCTSKYSDADIKDCTALRFMNKNTETYTGAFKTPTLRNVAERAPYMHAGQFATLREVLFFYKFWPDFIGGPPELEHTNITEKELKYIEAFLKTLSAPLEFVGKE